MVLRTWPPLKVPVFSTKRGIYRGKTQPIGKSDGLSRALDINGMVYTKSVGGIQSARTGRARGIKHVLVLLAFGSEFCGPSARAQQPDQAWQTEVRKYSDCRDWDDALRIVDRQIARSPGDLDIRVWRAQVLTWAGRLPEAEREFKEILKP